MRIKLCYYIPGIQNGKLDEDNCRQAAVKVQQAMKDDSVHKIFNWEDEFNKIQEKTWSKAQKYGNWLTRKVKKGICFLGMDMGLYMLNLRGRQASPLYVALHARLRDEIAKDIEILKARGQEVELWLISHSFGTYVSLDFTINNPDMEFRLVTFGSPLSYFSDGYPDSGDPSKLVNIKKWTNIIYENDPIIAYPFYDNDGPNRAKWQTFVQDIIIRSPSMFPMKTHGSYWGDDKFQVELINLLK